MRLLLRSWALQEGFTKTMKEQMPDPRYMMAVFFLAAVAGLAFTILAVVATIHFITKYW
jgi:hypothetical protein